MDMGNFFDNMKLDSEKIKLEIEVQEEVLEDIIVVNAGRNNVANVPEGYVKIEVDLNEKAGGDYLYFCIKKGTDKSKAIDSLVVVEGKNAAAPAGYTMIKKDLNESAGGRYIYLCYC